MRALLEGTIRLGLSLVWITAYFAAYVQAISIIKYKIRSN